jgi:hypothetical protein
VAEQLILCAENLYNILQFPSHTITASSEATGFTVDRLANGRRHAGDRFESSVTNTDVTIKIRCDVMRAADFFAIDRASNHLGYRYQHAGSSDNFVAAANTRTLFDVNTIPLIPGGRPSESGGCVTSEGAWLKTVTVDAHHDYQTTVKAMGSGLKPQITGLWWGRSYSPTVRVLRSIEQESGFDVSFEDTRSPYGWQGRGQIAAPHSGSLDLRLTSDYDEPAIRYHVLNLYKRGFPMWIVWRKTDSPWNAILATCPKGARLSLDYDQAWPIPGGRRIVVPFEETQAAA